MSLCKLNTCLSVTLCAIAVTLPRYPVQYLKDKLAELTDEISEIVQDPETLILENEGKVRATLRRVFELGKQNAATSGMCFYVALLILYILIVHW